MTPRRIALFYGGAFLISLGVGFATLPAPVTQAASARDTHTFYVWCRDRAQCPHGSLVEMPWEMARDAAAVFLACEAKPWWRPAGPEPYPYRDPENAESATGDFGGMQLNRRWHEGTMRGQGLDFDNPLHRWRYAINVVWARSGWGPWSCKPGEKP